jgi:3-hydroxy-9,10-secoandrosta-1,3,5(10)-triene-9,17-dione monooxygenase
MMTAAGVSGEIDHGVRQPAVTPAILVSRAQSLREHLLGEQEAAEALGHYSAQIHAEFLEAGFYHILTPSKYGGFEFDVPAYVKVMMELGRGDPSTAWCLALGSGHNLTLAAFWDEQAQDEIIQNPAGYFSAPHSAMPTGTALPVDGGYIVSGRWDYCSGIPHATHFKGTARVAGNGERPAARVVVLPAGEFEILDNWGNGSALGMQGSGSNSVVVQDVFVPRHRTVPFDWLDPVNVPHAPGTSLHANPMYQARISGYYHMEIVSSVVGAARAAQDEYERLLMTRKTSRPPVIPRFQDDDFQRDFGLVMAYADAAEALLMRAAGLYMHYCDEAARDVQPFTYEMDMRLWALVQQAGRLASESVEHAWRTAGSSAGKRGERLQRYYRDVSMYRQHIAAQPVTLARYLTRNHFGIPSSPLG